MFLSCYRDPNLSYSNTVTFLLLPAQKQANFRQTWVSHTRQKHTQTSSILTVCCKLISDVGRDKIYQNETMDHSLQTILPSGAPGVGMTKSASIDQTFFAFQFTLSGRNDSKEKRNRRKTLLSQSTSRRKGASVENCVKVSLLSVTSDFRNYSYFLLTQPVLYKIQYNFIFPPMDNFNLDFVPSSS